jgi:hypothetical protein
MAREKLLAVWFQQLSKLRQKRPFQHSTNKRKKNVFIVD